MTLALQNRAGRLSADCGCATCRQSVSTPVSPGQLELVPAAELRPATGGHLEGVETGAVLPAGLFPTLPDGMSPMTASQARLTVLAEATDRRAAVRELLARGLAVVVGGGGAR